jgi:hypothetical protein
MEVNERNRQPKTVVTLYAQEEVLQTPITAALASEAGRMTGHRGAYNARLRCQRRPPVCIHQRRGLMCWTLVYRLNNIIESYKLRTTTNERQSEFHLARDRGPVHT